MFERVGKQIEFGGSTRHVTLIIIFNETFTQRGPTRANLYFYLVGFVRCFATSEPAHTNMRRPVISAADDVIVEPIEEAVAIYENLLKELYKFMVSDWFVGDSRALWEQQDTSLFEYTTNMYSRWPTICAFHACSVTACGPF